MNKLFFPLVNLYKDNCLQLMHEKLKNQQLDTWEELQNAICKEKEARERKMNELMSQKTNNNCTKIVNELTRKSIKNHSKKQLETNFEKVSEPIEIVQVPTLPLASVGQKCRTFLPEEPNDDIGMDSDIEYGTESKMLWPNPHKERRIDYHYFYRFDANAISCRHCPYRRPAQKRFKPTRALKSHLKTHHLTVLEQYRRSNDILKEDSEKSKKEEEDEPPKQKQKNGRESKK
ncbi:hypothetical protein niasHS_009889 [Heterodera schachtii]|uniref:BED-type domain-containing protein n=1 Tax=Heterodera schachtii TaxID=97005 RepID=A0ABD2JCT9_HETSC